MNSLRCLTVKVDVIAGSNIDEAIRDLCEFAGRIGAIAETKINDVMVLAKPNDDPSQLLLAFNEVAHTNRTHKIAVLS